MLPEGQEGLNESGTGAREVERGSESNEAESRACTAGSQCNCFPCPPTGICFRAEVIEQSTISKRGFPAAETFPRGRIAPAAQTCGRERITAFQSLRVIWIIVVGARQASGPAVIARRQKVVVIKFLLEPVSRAAAGSPTPTSAGCPAERCIQL
jgi:hypothetical protein